MKEEATALFLLVLAAIGFVLAAGYANNGCEKANTERMKNCIESGGTYLRGDCIKGAK